jgi:hypothetical protein
MNFLKPWFADTSQSFAEELRREIRPGHALFEVNVAPIARRRDRDDVLFALLDGTDRLAVVHLTYARLPHPNYPTVRLFSNFGEWEEAMKIDHRESS